MDNLFDKLVNDRLSENCVAQRSESNTNSEVDDYIIYSYVCVCA